MSGADESPLFPVSPAKYGDAYKQHLLEQYKLYVDSADRISERRTSANNYLLTVNASLVSLYGLASTFDTSTAWRFLVPVAGILVCTSWYLLIRNYRGLNSGKFRVIHELEQRLPAAPYDHEWNIIERGIGKAYKPITHIEQWIPLIFAGLYLTLLVYAFAFASRVPTATTTAPPSRQPPAIVNAPKQ